MQRNKELFIRQREIEDKESSEFWEKFMRDKYYPYPDKDKVVKIVKERNIKYDLYKYMDSIIEEEYKDMGFYNNPSILSQINDTSSYKMLTINGLQGIVEKIFYYS